MHPLQVLRQKSFDVAGLFYNPNIHPFTEYQRRKEALLGFAKESCLAVVAPQYEPRDFFRAVTLREAPPDRCRLCWALRLKEAARSAKIGAFDFFSTTLLVSPYQDQQALKTIGEALAQEEGVGFYYEDFRPGFRKAHAAAHAKGMYCQKYCGCIYSEIERVERHR